MYLNAFMIGFIIASLLLIDLIY